MATNEKVLQGKCTNSLLRVCVPVCYTICMCEHACHSLQVGLILSFHLYTGFRDQTYQACNPQGASALPSEPSPQFSQFPCQEIHLYATDGHSIAGQPQTRGYVMWFKLPHFTEVETEAQGGLVACCSQTSHRWMNTS